MKTRTKILAVLAFLALCSICLADELLVPSQYPTIQAAIDAAFDGDAVLVADGIYTGPGNRDIDFLGKAITVRGTDPEDPNVVAATIIDCQNKGCGFYFHNGENSNSILDGLTITRGYHSDSGGGIRCWKSHPKITNCNITGNSARYCGGGMFNNYSDPTLINCTFSKNSAPDRGGAIWCHSGSNPHLVNCNFIQNSAGSGGAISEGSPTVLNCFFTENSASSQGGGILSCDNSPKLTSCTFTGNSAASGGAIFNSASTGNAAASPVVNNCVFIGNTATGYGGAILNSSGTGDAKASPIIMNSLFVGNKAGSFGGGMYNLSGTGDAKASPIIMNSLFVGNKAGSFGGGMYNSSGTGNAKTRPTVVNCTFSSNLAAGGGGMYNRRGILTSDTVVTIKNSIFWDNDGTQIVVASGSTVVSYSCIQDGFSGTGNIDADPCFVQPGYWADANDPNIIVEPNDPNAIWIDGDYHLLPISPCINAGDPNYIVEPNETDLDGNPRVNGGRIDMGAYESIMHEARLRLWPRVINRKSRQPRIMVWLRLPQGITKDQVDKDEPLILYPGGIEAVRQFVFQNRRRGDNRTSVFAFFNKAELMDAIDTNGRVQLLVLGHLLEPGQYFYGSDTIRIIAHRLPRRPHHRRR